MLHNEPGHHRFRRFGLQWVAEMPARRGSADRSARRCAAGLAWLGVCLATTTSLAVDPGFRLAIDRTDVSAVTIRYPSAPGQSFVLLQGFEATQIATPVFTNAGVSGEGQFVVAADSLATSFFRIERQVPPPSANLPPVVTLVRPLPGSTFVAPADWPNFSRTLP